jgi:hypothetical protein
MSDDTIEPFRFPAVGRKKLTAAFDGGRLTSDGGVMLLAAAERRIGIAELVAALIADLRDPLLVTHSVADILRARMLAIACGYEDADDLDHLRTDPGFKLACGRLPDSGRDLCSQPTMSRWENAPSLREVMRMTYAMVDVYCASYACLQGIVPLQCRDREHHGVQGHQLLSKRQGVQPGQDFGRGRIGHRADIGPTIGGFQAHASRDGQRLVVGLLVMQDLAKVAAMLPAV